jgi:hypothetical protein
MGPPLPMDGIAVYQELRATGKFEVMNLSVDEAEHSMEMHLPYLAKVFKGYVWCESKFLMKCVSCYNWSIKFLCKRRTHMREHRKEIMAISLHHSNIRKFSLCFFPDFLDDDYR